VPDELSNIEIKICISRRSNFDRHL